MSCLWGAGPSKPSLGRRCAAQAERVTADASPSKVDPDRGAVWCRGAVLDAGEVLQGRACSHAASSSLRPLISRRSSPFLRAWSWKLASMASLYC